MSLDSNSVLGEEGLISRRLERYESRPEQLQMADAVAGAIRDGSHLLVEAGTGVGKSFAYLVPAILSVAGERPAEDAARRKVLISTNTISLQEQLIHRDIPFLNAVLPVEFSAVLVKGRGNYISLRRLKGAVERAQTMFADPEPLAELHQIRKWSTETTDGSMSDLPFRPSSDVWDEVRSEHSNCLGRKCPTHEQCFYYAARRRVWNADLLVVNHALFFSDLALRREGASVLPDYDVVIFDEAHSIESVASDHLGLAVSRGQIEYLLQKLYNDRSQRGLLVHHQLVECQQMVSRLHYLVEDFFSHVTDYLRQTCGDNGRVHAPPGLDNPLTPEFQQLGGAIQQAAQKITSEEARIELTSAAMRCATLGTSLQTWLTQDLADAVYWIELSGRRRQNVRLNCAPVEVADVLNEELFNRVRTCILTSATLAVGQDDFQFTRSRLGLTAARELKLGSPFDYRNQAQLILPEGMPDPTGDPARYEAAVCRHICRYVEQTAGRAFVLFTSYKMLNSCRHRLAGWFRENQFSLYSQGDDLPRTAMLERFRNDPAAVLFGTDSFWQGVDVPGDALQNVIITKLPFSVPDHPLLEARVEAIRRRGGNPFIQYQVPEAIIKLKQGFGRLIRSRNDRGQVVILDPRVRTKPYGRLFLQSLPDAEVIIDDATD